MRLIGKLTPKLSLRGTISKTAEVIGSNVQPLRVEENGVYEVFGDIDGFNPVCVNTPEPKEEQTKTLNVDENGFYEVLPDNEKVLYSAKINVNVPPKEEQEKVVDITENGTTEVLPDENKVLSKVTVNANIPDTSELIETLIDNSGVLDSTEGTATEKVGQLIDKARYELNAFMHIPNAYGVFKNAKSFPTKAVVNLPNAVGVYQAFSYWDTEPIPIVEELTVNAPNISVRNNQACMGQMFMYNSGVKKVELNMPDGCQYMASTFTQAKILEEIVLSFSTKNIKDYTQAFSGCTALKKINGVLDFSFATNVRYMFDNCNSLEEMRFEPNTLSLSISLPRSSKLTSESVQSIIDGLATVTTAQTLTLHKNIVLTDEQKATINAKGWTLAQ